MARQYLGNVEGMRGQRGFRVYGITFDILADEKLDDLGFVREEIISVPGSPPVERYTAPAVGDYLVNRSPWSNPLLAEPVHYVGWDGVTTADKPLYRLMVGQGFMITALTADWHYEVDIDHPVMFRGPHGYRSIHAWGEIQGGTGITVASQLDLDAWVAGRVSEVTNPFNGV